MPCSLSKHNLWDFEFHQKWRVSENSLSVHVGRSLFLCYIIIIMRKEFEKKM